VIQAISYGVFLITVGGIFFQSLSGRVIFSLQPLKNLRKLWAVRN